MKISKKEKSTPWLNADGTKKTDKQIEELGKNWSPEIWNFYLDSNVGILKDTRLSFLSNMDTEEMLERSEVIEYLEDGQHYKKLEVALLLALTELSRAERVIIKKSFWNLNSDKEIAKDLNKTHKNIRVLKSRALQKLRKILASTKLKNNIETLKSNNRLEQIIYQEKQLIMSDSLTLR